MSVFFPFGYGTPYKPAHVLIPTNTHRLGKTTQQVCANARHLENSLVLLNKINTSKHTLKHTITHTLTHTLTHTNTHLTHTNHVWHKQ